MEDDYIKMEKYAELDYLKMEALCVGKTKQNQPFSSRGNFEGIVKTQEKTDLLQHKTKRGVDMQNSHQRTQVLDDLGRIKQGRTGSDEENRKDVHEEINDIFCEKRANLNSTLISPKSSSECHALSSKQVAIPKLPPKKQHMNQIEENEETNYSTVRGKKNDPCQEQPDIEYRYKSLAQTHSQKERTLVFTGLTTIESDRVVIVTDKGQILVLRRDGLFLFLREFDESFGDVTTVFCNEIVASCGFRVRFFLVHETDIKEREEKILNFQYEETTVHGISCNARKLLMSCNLQSVVSSEHPLIKLYDLKKKVSTTIASSKFNYPGRVVMNSDASKFYVADQTNKSITCLDTNGLVLWETTETNSPASFVLSKDFLLVAFEESMELKCFFPHNGHFLKSLHVTVEDCLASKTLLLGKNSSSLILCLCQHEIGNMSNFVFFADTEEVHKHIHLGSRQTKKSMLKKFFPWTN